MRISPRYFRPSEVETLLGDATKARAELGWVPLISAKELCSEMVTEDYKVAMRNSVLKAHGLDVPIALED